MDNSYVAIIGKGISSRANVEALVEDYLYVKGKDVYLVIAFEKTPSQGQIFAAQYAKDRGKEIVIFCKDGANVGPFPSATISFTNTPLSEAIDTSDSVMVLWDDTDEESLEAVTYCSKVNKKPLNLCEGLSLIPVPGPAQEAVEEPLEALEEPTYDAPLEGLTEAQKAEIKKAVLEAVETALQGALGRL